MSDVCAVTPLVSGKPSKFYNELWTYTGKNKRLTNFLYAVGTDVSSLASFDKKEINSQGEPYLDSFREKFNSDRFLTTVAETTSEQRSIGAIDDQGATINYDSPNALYQKVVDYNDEHERHKAHIVRNAEGKYNIILRGTDAGNYRNNEVIASRVAQFEGILEYLNSIGFSTNFPESIKNSVANFVTVRAFENIIRSLAFSKEPYTDTSAEILLYLMQDNPHVTRLLGQFDNMGTLAKAVRMVHNDKAESDDPNLSEYQINQIKLFLGAAQRALGAADSGDLEEYKGEKLAQLENKNVSFFGIPSDVLNKSLRELYNRYHLDQDLIQGLNQDLSTLSSIASKIYDIEEAKKNISIARNQKPTNNEELKALSRQLSNGEYASSVMSFLQRVTADFETLLENHKTYLNAIPEINTSNERDLDKVSTISRFFLDTIKLAEAYRPIIGKLMIADAIELDQPGLDTSFISAVKTMAKHINSIINEAESRAREAQFDVVYAFIKMTGSWGESDLKTMSNGDTVSLRTVLKTMQNDPGFFDRMIYSVNNCSDMGLALLHQSIRARVRARDAALRDIMIDIRNLTDMLYKSGIDSSFVYERDENGKPTGRLVGEIDYAKYEQDRKAAYTKLKQRGLRDKSLRMAMFDWEVRHNTYGKEDGSSGYSPYSNVSTYTDAFREYYRKLYGKDFVVENVQPDGRVISGPGKYVFSMNPRIDMYRNEHFDDGWTEVQKEYYYKMMALKTALTVNIPEHLELFDAVQLSSNMVNRVNETGLLETIRTEFADAFVRREDDEEFGASFPTVLAKNGIRTAIRDVNGHELFTVPILYTNKLKDMERLSTNFTESLVAFAQASLHYYEMNRALDAFELAGDYFKTQRKGNQAEGGKTFVEIIHNFGNAVSRAVIKDPSGDLITDLYERDIYGRKQKDEGTVSLFGQDVSISKAANWLTGFTSRSGLSLNVLGAQANALVGKIQMFIEGSAGEFFNMKDLAAAEVNYFQLLVPHLNEFASNNRKALLSLLGDKFDIMGDFFQKLRESGFNRTAIAKIIGSGNLFLLYHLGEHLLHYEPALAVLHHIKVFDTKKNTEVSLLEAYKESYNRYDEEHPSDANYPLVLDDRYEWIERDEKGEMASHRAITDKDLLRVEKNIKYVNDSMNGAFNDLDRGLGSRMAVIRLVMNFRQWMPAHYERRFRGLNYDADLGDFRKGYYRSGFAFLGGCISDLARGKVQIATRWNELSDMDRYNLKRCLAELEVLMTLSIANLSLGEYKDKKGNWAYRNLMYQVKRMLMETQASTPIPDLLPLLTGKPTDPMAFVSNIITVLNSPIAAIKSVEDLMAILDFTKLFLTVESGKDAGENLYWHTFKKRAPYVRSAQRAINLADEDYLFNIFK